MAKPPCHALSISVVCTLGEKTRRGEHGGDFRRHIHLNNNVIAVLHVRGGGSVAAGKEAGLFTGLRVTQSVKQLQPRHLHAALVAAVLASLAVGQVDAAAHTPTHNT